MLVRLVYIYKTNSFSTIERERERERERESFEYVFELFLFNGYSSYHQQGWLCCTCFAYFFSCYSWKILSYYNP